MKVVILGLTTTSRGGIAQYTNSLYTLFKEHHKTYLVPIVRQLFRDIYKSKDNQDVHKPSSQEAKDEWLVSLDPANPINWLHIGWSISKLKPDGVIVTWWATTYWILSIGVVCKLIHIFAPKTRIVYWCHDVRFQGASRIRSGLVRSSLDQADGYLVHTQPQAKAILEIVPGAFVRVNPLPMLANGFPKDVLARSEARNKLGVPQTGEIALFFGYIASYKGLEDLIDAAPLVKDEVSNFHLLIAGEIGDDSAPILDIIRGLKADTFTTIVDRYIPDEEVQLYFRSANVLVLPYRDATQSGVAMLAYEFCLPIIASRVGGMPEILVHNLSGILIQPGDVRGLSRALIKFFNNDMESRLVKGMDSQQAAFAPILLMQAIEELIVDLREDPTMG